MQALKLSKKFPQFSQQDVFGLLEQFQKLDVDEKGYLDQAKTIKAGEDLEHVSYDEARAALKSVELDSSGRVEQEDFVDVGVSEYALWSC